MRKAKIFLALILMGMLPLLLSCGGGGGGGDGGDGGGVTVYKTAEYYPLAQEDTWTYRETEEDGEIDYDTKIVRGTETIDGVVATKVLSGSDKYELRTVDSNGITLYKEYEVENGGWVQMVFNPPLNLLPAEVSIGTKKTINSTMNHTNSEGETGTETISGETTVEGIENVTVPAGTFNDCLKIKIKVTLTSPEETEIEEITMFFAKGVGMVKEISQETEPDEPVETDVSELVSATVGGVSYPK